MIITKEGFCKLEEGEFEITSNAIMSTLVCNWLLSKRYNVDDLESKGLNWYCEIGESVEPREFFNYVYISEIVRDGHTSPPSSYWRNLADVRVFRGERVPLWKKVANMYRVLEECGWSPDPYKSKWGSIMKALKKLGWTRSTLYNYIKRYPEAPEPPWENRFARMILNHYEKAYEKIGEFWYWKASSLLPPQYGGQGYMPDLSESDFMKHNEGRNKLDFSVLDEMYEEFCKIKLVDCGFRSMIITKGEPNLTDLREPPWQGTTIIDQISYELTGEIPQQNRKKRQVHASTF